MMVYFKGNQAVEKKVFSAFPAVELYDGALYGILECRFTEPLTSDELKILKEYWLGQMSDGWGEDFEQQEIHTGSGELYVSFWNADPHYRIITEWELKGMEDVEEIKQEELHRKEPGMGLNLSM
jgi:hypothetical protein